MLPRFVASALAQMTPRGSEPAHTASQPYDIETFGVFRTMMLEGEFSPKVALADAMAKHPSTGVGAIADARGEITIFDGKLYVSYGKPGEHAALDKDRAALLVLGTAKAWQSILIERNLPPPEVESFIAAAAKAHGVDPEKSFPFELRGSLAPYAMHVLASPIDGPHGMGLPMANTVATKGEEIPGTVAGLYVSPDLVGVATHGGERTHAHWLAPDRQRTAHLDQWGIKAGSALLIPKH